MTYKNGIKEYTLTTILFGTAMGLIFGLYLKSLFGGIITGIVNGVLFTFVIFLFVKHQEKRFANKRTEIAKERKIICDGVATIQGNGGWLFLTENRLEFYPHQINFSTKEIQIPINTIESVKTNFNQIVISTAQPSTVAILVSHNKEWKKQIDAMLKKTLQD